MVHIVRHSLNFVTRKRRPEMAVDFKHIYTAATADEAEQRFGEFIEVETLITSPRSVRIFKQLRGDYGLPQVLRTD